ncbi:hypothetical protein AAF712_005140 [Marasmius tenuissimus]|uniref:Uncharacterized protein n=1 Tax=Marasmius tenuissimus TaxID=585030 RepID=A0ABR3A2J7_9AGAR
MPRSPHKIAMAKSDIRLEVETMPPHQSYCHRTLRRTLAEYLSTLSRPIPFDCGTTNMEAIGNFGFLDWMETRFMQEGEIKNEVMEGCGLESGNEGDSKENTKEESIVDSEEDNEEDNEENSEENSEGETDTLPNLVVCRFRTGRQGHGVVQARTSGGQTVISVDQTARVAGTSGCRGTGSVESSCRLCLSISVLSLKESVKLTFHRVKERTVISFFKTINDR